MYRITIEEIGLDKDGALRDPAIIYKKESNDYQQVKEVLKKVIDIKGDTIHEY